MQPPENDAGFPPNKPLANVKVVDLGLWIAGPAAAAMLADWGADVVKVEPPKGDPARSAMASILGIENMRSPAFIADNRGKRSVVLELGEQAGMSALEDLLRDADVFVTNIRPNALARLDISPETLREKFPQLIIAQVTGYGSSGPEINRPGYDSGAFWAYSGLAKQFSAETGYPPILPPAFGDHMTSMALVSGISTALFNRTRTGTGCIVETSLLKLGIYAATSDYALRMEFDRPRRPQRRADSESPLVNNYKTADERYFWLLCVEAGRHWPALCHAIERADLLEDERFKRTIDRHKSRAALIAELDTTFASKTRDEWAAIFDEHDIWWSPVNTLEEVIESEQAREIKAFVDLPANQHIGDMRTVAAPIDFDRCASQPAGHCPELGEHSEEVFTHLKKNTT